MPSKWKLALPAAALCILLSASAQTPFDPGLKPKSPTVPNPLTQPTLSQGTLELLTLEGQFAQAVLKGGGKTFAEWFAPDAVILNNKRAAVIGQTRIAAEAQWKPDEYQLTWVAQGAQMGPSNDMGFTWGHYEGRSKDKNGQPVVLSGRFITVWKKMPDGKWKVAMDASAEDAPEAGDCCKLPNP